MLDYMMRGGTVKKRRRREVREREREKEKQNKTNKAA